MLKRGRLGQVDRPRVPFAPRINSSLIVIVFGLCDIQYSTVLYTRARVALCDAVLGPARLLGSSPSVAGIAVPLT